MTKRILKITLLLALVAGFYAMNAHAKGDRHEPAQTAQPSPAVTVTPWTCEVFTGIEGGTVNLRACEGVACGAVLDVLTEGERLKILQAGLSVKVTTEGGLTGWLNSRYCKGK